MPSGTDRRTRPRTAVAVARRLREDDGSAVVEFLGLALILLVPVIYLLLFVAQAQAAAFADDPRVHFDRQAGAWRFEQDDGTELEYDAAKGAWVPVVSASICMCSWAHRTQDPAWRAAG